MVDLEHIDAKRRHWYVDEHFASQLGNPSARAVVEGRWRLFTAEIRRWLGSYAAGTNRARPIEVLDAGCGDGINLLGLARIFGELGRPIALTGIDYNELRIGRARELGLDCRLEVGSLDATGLAGQSLDLVLINHVLEHIPQKAEVLGELHRILRPGGLLIVGVPNEGCTLAKLRNHVLQPGVMRTTDHVHFFTAPALRRDLSAAGFTVDRVVGEGFFVPHLRVASMVGRSGAGRQVLATLGKAMPSQAAGLIAIALASHGAAG